MSQQVSKRTLLDPHLSCSNHASAVKFGSMCGTPIPDSPECTAWRNSAGLGAIGRVVVGVRLENVLQSVSRCSARDLLAGPSAAPFLQSLVRILMIDVPTAYLPRLLRTHAVLATRDGDGNLKSLRTRIVESSETNTSMTRPVLYFSVRMFSIMAPSIDRGFVNSLACRYNPFSSALHSGLVLRS